jgi:hypothetical protein
VGHNLVANNQCNYNARRGIKVQEIGATVTGNPLVLNSCGIGVTVTPNPTSTPTVISGNTIKDSNLQGTNLVNRFGLALDASGGACERVNIVGNTSQNSGTGTTQTHGFVVSSTADRINLVCNIAVSGLTVQFSISTTATPFSKQGLCELSRLMYRTIVMTYQVTSSKQYLRAIVPTLDLRIWNRPTAKTSKVVLYRLDTGALEVKFLSHGCGELDSFPQQ